MRRRNRKSRNRRRNDRRSRKGRNGRRKVTLPVQEAGMMRETNVFSGN